VLLRRDLDGSIARVSTIAGAMTFHHTKDKGQAVRGRLEGRGDIDFGGANQNTRPR
jgi:hypothetical protein